MSQAVSVDQQRVRVVIIGVGASVLNMHREGLALPEIAIVGGSDVDPTRGRARAEELGCPYYPDYHPMLDELRPDLAVVVAPHPFHAEIALACFAAGCHVLVEKPMALQVADADAMIAAAERAGRLLAVSFQRRYRSDMEAVHRLLHASGLGALEHVELHAVWPRSAAYFAQAPWRGTWRGEGGGVLMNQGIHNLDSLIYLVGMPQRVVAWTRTRLHRIEVEDTVDALLEWADGMLGTVHISTAEMGPEERILLTGSRGIVEVTPEAAHLQTSERDLRDLIAQSPEPMLTPQLQPEALAPEPDASGHVAVYRDVVDAILHGSALRHDGVSGRMALELANAMIFSSHRGTPVDLPLDRQAYAALLDELRTGA